MKVPQPYYGTAKPLKAFVLGCDPTAFDKNKTRLQFKNVFDIDGDGRYFASVLANLKALGIYLDDIYVQNLVTDYQEKETAKNKHWEVVALRYVPDRRIEFDRIDPSKKMPVSLTSELLYKALLNDAEEREKAKDLYDSEEVVIPAEKNKFGRPLIALYRHYQYNQYHKQDYFLKVKSYLSK